MPWKFTESSTEHKIIRNIYNEERRCADCIAALLFTGGVFYRNQNTERSPRLSRKHLFRPEHAAVHLLGAGHRRGGGHLLCLAAVCRHRRNRLDVHSWCCAVRRLRLFHLPRHDRRTSAVGLVQVRNSLPETPRVQVRQLLLRSHAARHPRGHETKERFAYEEKHP